MDVSSTESYADYLGTFQQLTTPFISFSETASQIKATVDLTDTKGNILDSAKTFVAVLSEESNAK
ncbi:hypothetical protein IV55_GL000789 [Furfurilactobacillus siliginis]|nr:hypothetical protein IV55_GL000789 [Furfurilactobacillus siliginis]